MGRHLSGDADINSMCLGTIEHEGLLIMPFLKKKPTVKGKPINAMIIVESTKKRIFRHVPKRVIPKDSFEREYNGQHIHILGLDLLGKLWPITVPPKIVKNELPTDLFQAKHCAPEVDAVYGLSSSTIQKIKIGILVGKLDIGIIEQALLKFPAKFYFITQIDL